nr:putative transposase [Ipomoea batatas]GMD81939.1 putative transposase [Ipomoea batatas]GMD91755.1 putative transposase [Ipomoea batatas]
MDDSEIPSELESIRNKAMVFKVSIKDQHLKNPAKPIPVLKITNDDELVSVYCPSLTDDHDELSKMIGEELQDEESDNFTTWLVVQVDGAADMICGCVGLCSLGEPERVYIDAGEPEKGRWSWRVGCLL